MSFTIDGTVLATAINDVLRVAGKSGPDDKESHVTMTGSKEKGTITFRGFSANGRYITKIIKTGTVNADFSFGVPTDRLPAIVNKRSELAFTIDAKTGTLSYKSVKGAYRGYIETMAQKNIEFPSTKKADLSAIDEALRLAIFELQSHVAISPHFTDNKSARDMTMFIQADSTLWVGAADQYHMALVQHPLESKNASSKTKKFAFPFQYVSLISSIFAKRDNIKLGVDKAHMHVSNGTTHIVLPLIDTKSDKIQIDDILKFMKDHNEKKPDAVFEAAVEDITLCLANMEGVHDVAKSPDLVMSLTGSTLRLKMTSRHGSISDTVSVKAAKILANKDVANFMTQPDLLGDSLQKTAGACTFRFYGNGTICMIERVADDGTRMYYATVGNKPKDEEKESKKAKQKPSKE